MLRGGFTGFEDHRVFAQILEWVSTWIIHVISIAGYGGVALLMAIESACIPLPSEVIMPFAGALTVASVAATHAREPLNLWAVAVAGAIGCNLGSVVAYFVGAWLGRPFLEKTRWVRFFVTPHELERVDRWFDSRGPIVVFVARLLPVVRTFIALPAGIARMRQAKFHVYTFVGSLPWCLMLAYVGRWAGANWQEAGLGKWLHRLDFVIVLAIVGGAVWFVRSRVIALRVHRERQSADQAPPV